MKRTLALALLVCASCFAGYAVFKSFHRPKYVFINETDDHRHDLALKMSLKAAESRSSVENALILIKELPPGFDIQRAGTELFRRWQIGKMRGGRGVLFLYSEKENLFKIEVGYAMEGVFPDALCHRLEQAAQTYMLSEVPQDFLSELIITMNLRAMSEKSDEPEPTGTRPEWLNAKFLSGGAGIREKGYRKTLADYEEAVRSLPVANLRRFKPSEDVDETMRRYLQSLELGIGDPRLPLLTEGSRIFRGIVPRSQEQQRRVYDYFEKSMPFEILREGELALAVFKPGIVANLPVVLRHGTDGLWYVDEPKAWTWFHRFEDGGVDFFPKYDDDVFLPDLRRMRQPNANKPIYRGRVATPSPEPYPFSLEMRVHDLERRIQKDPKNSRLYAELGDLYLFEVDWISRSLELFERAAALAPDRLDYRWRLYDLYLNDSQAEKMLDTLQFIADRSPRDAEVQSWNRFYKGIYSIGRGEFPPTSAKAFQ